MAKRNNKIKKQHEHNEKKGFQKDRKHNDSLVEGTMESGTPYDDAFHTMYVECDELILPLLNEMFHEEYKGDEKILRNGTVHYIHEPDSKEQKRIADAFLEVEGSGKTKPYHVECESGTDGTIIVRMFQYGALLAIDNGKLEENKLCVEFPNAAVLFLRSTSTTPDSMEICIGTPSGSLSYQIPAMKMKAYTVEELFNRKLYFLLPFYIFNLEKELPKCEEDNGKLENLKELYNGILSKLEEDELKGMLSAFSRAVITDLMKNVVNKLAGKYENVKKGLGDTMGGKVLELEAIKIRNAGRREGIEQGKEEGIKQGKEEGIKQGKEEGIKQGKEEGLKQGKKEGLKQGTEEGIRGAVILLRGAGQSDETIKTSIMGVYHITEEAAAGYLKSTGQE